MASIYRSVPSLNFNHPNISLGNFELGPDIMKTCSVPPASNLPQISPSKTPQLLSSVSTLVLPSLEPFPAPVVPILDAPGLEEGHRVGGRAAQGGHGHCQGEGEGGEKTLVEDVGGG